METLVYFVYHMIMAFDDRIEFEGDLGEVIDRIVRDYDLGALLGFNVIEVGFEDYNIRLETSQGKYLTKIFSKKRSDQEVNRYITTIARVVDVGVRHPRPLSINGSLLYVDLESHLRLIIMDFIDGQTFYDLGILPNKSELALICAEAVKIHAIDYKPEFIFDSWAIPNMRWMYEKVKNDLSVEGLELVEKAFEYFDVIPFDKLPQCFVHGDLTKANTIRGNDEKVYIIDFAVSNVYPRIQELAVMAANLLFDEKSGTSASLKERCASVIDAYEAAGGQLTEIEKQNVFNYALPAAAMEYMGSVNERIVGDDSDEILYWEKLGFESLREALVI